MSEAWSHYHVFIDALKLFFEEFLHPSCSIYLGMDLQHFWVGLMIVDSTVRLFWAEPNVDLGPRREPLGGSGGMLPQKILKSKGLEMLFPAFSKSYL